MNLSIEYGQVLTFSKCFYAGETIVPLEGLSKGPKAYTSVQCGPGSDDNVELNSDLVFGEYIVTRKLSIAKRICASQSFLRTECSI